MEILEWFSIFEVVSAYTPIEIKSILSLRIFVENQKRNRILHLYMTKWAKRPSHVTVPFTNIKMAKNLNLARFTITFYLPDLLLVHKILKTKNIFISHGVA